MGSITCNPRRSVSDLASSEKTDEPPAASEWEIGMAIWVPGASAVWARRALPRVGDGRAGVPAGRRRQCLYGGLVTAARFMLNACVSVFICAESC